MNIVPGRIQRVYWVAHAQRGSKILPLHPRYFPLTYESRDELEAAIFDRIATDRGFAQRFIGWQFLCCDVGRAIEIKPAPSVERPAVTIGGEYGH